MFALACFAILSHVDHMTIHFDSKVFPNAFSLVFSKLLLSKATIKDLFIIKIN